MRAAKLVMSALFALVGLGATDGARAETVMASWYHARHANGVAHNRLPVGTRVGLYNGATGRHAEGRVEGTGPFVKRRGVDVSRQLAVLLGFVKKGVTPLRVTAIGR